MSTTLPNGHYGRYAYKLDICIRYCELRAPPEVLLVRAVMAKGGENVNSVRIPTTD